MKVRYHKDFEKTFLNLSPKMQDKAMKAINTFKKDPHHPQLRNHALHGKQKSKRSIAAGGDLRLVFIEKDNYKIVLFLIVGTHTQVY